MRTIQGEIPAGPIADRENKYVFNEPSLFLYTPRIPKGKREREKERQHRENRAALSRDCPCRYKKKA